MGRCLDAVKEVIDTISGKVKLTDGTTDAEVEALTKALSVYLKSALDSSNDSINVAKMSKGEVTTPHNAISATAPSNEIDCSGFNALFVHVDLSATGTPDWTITIQGSPASGGTFVDLYELASGGSYVQMSSGALTTDRAFIFKGMPDFVKIVATENAGTGTCTVKVQPMNV